MAYIYKITNQINGKSYIGKTEKINPHERFKEHLRECKKDRCKNRPLYRAINKYGEENFKFEVLEETNFPEEREQYFIQYYNTYGNTGYNATLGGDGKKYIDEEKVIESYNRLKKIRSVAEELNICVDTVSSILKKNNIEIISSAQHSKIKSGKKVLQIDKNSDKILNEFNSIAEAERALGKRRKTHIGNVCNGKRKTCLGFKWKFKEE